MLTFPQKTVNFVWATVRTVKLPQRRGPRHLAHCSISADAARQQRGLSRRDLEAAIGSRGRVSEVLTRKRPLTLPMVRKLSALLHIPADVLIQDYPTRSAA